MVFLSGTFWVFCCICYIKSSNIRPTVFADDTNRFHSNQNIKTVINKMNVELKHVTESFNINKSSIALILLSQTH